MAAQEVTGQLVPIDSKAPQPTPMAILQLAIQQNADIDKLTKLMDLQERWEANEARKAYEEAFSEFKRNPPDIHKNKHVKFGNTEYDHATLDHVTEVIGKALSAHGISHRWDVQQTGDKIRVACVLTHKLGHSERTMLEAGADQSGSKNSIQAIGSAVTYLQRYSLLAATGMAVKGQDNDGVLLTGELKDILEIISKSATANELRAAYAEGIKTAKNSKEKVVLMDAYEKRKKELA